jgi:phospholipase C
MSTAAAARTGARAGASATPIRHVVVIYQENHSFNNVLGDLCVVDKRCVGSVAPVRLKGQGVVAQHIASDIVPPIHHDNLSQKTAVNNGRMNGWGGVIGCQAPAYACLSYYTPDQIPALASLARKFVIADHAFQSSFAPSWGAHLAFATGGTLDGFTGDNPQPTAGITVGPGWGCDSNKTADWVSPSGAVLSQPSCVPDYSLSLPNGGAFGSTSVANVPTIMDRLDAAGVSWKFYTPPSTSAGYVWAICPTFAECLDTTQANHLVPTTQIVTDAASGQLPAFSIVSPLMTASQHNKTSMAAGDNWIGQAVAAIENGPDWSTTAIFIAYDDCGCFYDSVAPPPGEGIRAPVVIVSPYARPAFTDTAPADVVGSILAFVEQTFNVAPLTSVDANAYNFSASFNFAQVPIRPAPLPKPLPTTPVVLSAADESDPT